MDTYVKKLLVVFHVGFLWLDKPHSIDVDLISTIMGLLWLGKDPEEKFQEVERLGNIAQTQEKYNLAISSE